MFTASLMQISQILEADLFGKNVDIQGISIDSRTTKAGNLFIAIKGDKFDGHDFIAQAIANGAVAAISLCDFNTDIPFVRVMDTTAALGKLANWWRMQFADVKIYAITGSAGKTTTKNMLTSILREYLGADSVLATEGNFNNHLGVPLTLLRLGAEHQVAVIEMGANHLGEIAYLTQLVKPDIGVITNVGTAHIGEFDGFEQVLQAKSELISNMDANAGFVFNASYSQSYCIDRWMKDYLQENQSVICFAFSDDYQELGKYHLGCVKATNIVHHDFSSSFVLNFGDDKQLFELNLPGKHNISNALAAVAAAQYMQIPLDSCASGLRKITAASGRFNHSIMGDMRIIDDSYNANFEAVIAAIDYLSFAAGKKILVLGELGELGEFAEQLIFKIADYAQDKLDAIYVIGKQSDIWRQFIPHKDSKLRIVISFASDKKKIAACIYSTLQNNLKDKEEHQKVTVLIKGSRSAQLEDVVKEMMFLHDVAVKSDDYHLTKNQAGEHNVIDAA